MYMYIWLCMVYPHFHLFPFPILIAWINSKDMEACSCEGLVPVHSIICECWCYIREVDWMLHVIACRVPIAQNKRKKKTTSSNGWFVHDDELHPVVKLPDSLFSLLSRVLCSKVTHMYLYSCCWQTHLAPSPFCGGGTQELYRVIDIYCMWNGGRL